MKAFRFLTFTWLVGIALVALITLVFNPAKSLADTAASALPITKTSPSTGEKLALTHCGRCHRVSPRNRMGGIGSTPSFRLMRAFVDWEDRFRAFYVLNPHPSFTQIEGITEPFDDEHPSPIHPLMMTLEEIDEILAFVATIKPADLGQPVKYR